MEMQEVYEQVERATGMHNGRLARVFRRAVRQAVQESRAAAGALTQPTSELFATECHTPDSLHVAGLPHLRTVKSISHNMHTGSQVVPCCLPHPRTVREKAVWVGARYALKLASSASCRSWRDSSDSGACETQNYVQRL
jgi:hypothetical protein